MFFAFAGEAETRKLSEEECSILIKVVTIQCRKLIKSSTWENYRELREEAGAHAWVQIMEDSKALEKLREAVPKEENIGMERFTHTIVRNKICNYFRKVYKKQIENKKMVKKHGKLYSVIFDFFCKKRMKQLKDVWEQVHSVLPKTEFGDFLAVYSETKCNEQRYMRMADEVSLEGDISVFEEDEKNDVSAVRTEVHAAIYAKQVYNFLIENFKHDEIAIFKKLFEMDQHNTRGGEPRITQKQIAKSFGCQESKVSGVRKGEIIPKLGEFLETKFDIYSEAVFVQEIIKTALKDF